MLQVVDSSGWLEYFNGSDLAALYAPAIEDSDHLIVPVISIYEVFKKLRRAVGEEEAAAAASAMQNGHVVDLDVATALEATAHALSLADSIIYQVTLACEATLWTQDAHFEGLPSVRYFPKPTPPTPTAHDI